MCKRRPPVRAWCMPKRSQRLLCGLLVVGVVFEALGLLLLRNVFMPHVVSDPWQQKQYAQLAQQPEPDRERPPDVRLATALAPSSAAPLSSVSATVATATLATAASAPATTCNRSRVFNSWIPLRFIRVFGLWDSPLSLPSIGSCSSPTYAASTQAGRPTTQLNSSSNAASAEPLSRGLRIAGAVDTRERWLRGGQCALLRLVPARLASGLSQWHDLYPHWQHLLFKEHSSVKRFVLRYFPLHEQFYEKLPQRVQQADVLRLMLLYQFGGWYLDLDMAPSAAAVESNSAAKRGGVADPCVPSKYHLDHFLNTHLGCSAVVFHEAILTEAQAKENGRRFSIRKGVPEERVRIANYVFAAAPKHPFVMLLLDAIKERASTVGAPRSDYDVLYSTGPDIVSTVVAEVVARGIFSKELCVIERPEDQAFFQHHAFGTWRRTEH